VIKLLNENRYRDVQARDAMSRAAGEGQPRANPFP
jgi:hypothetical protein